MTFFKKDMFVRWWAWHFAEGCIRSMASMTFSKRMHSFDGERGILQKVTLVRWWARQIDDLPVFSQNAPVQAIPKFLSLPA
ncbi:MAG: hypothetical protein IJM92_15795 [Fibrobacter sp.]|uniref:hypothetical protein n=1 Tax=Fibrobacter sp. TaxID=35828 RepID=UPI0025C38848|nr:hypothetical protein [Fibrobacter sp.]MBQ7081086.1 hypothetical protein [Fibrobacter sp.]